MPSERAMPRWRYRFDNFSRAFLLLRAGIELMEQRDLSQLEKEGIVQRFEHTWELAWKVLRDYLEAEGVILDTVTPRSVLRAALAARVIDDGEVWMQALDARNKMSHVYSAAAFDRVIEDVRSRYLALLDALHFAFLERSAATDDHA